MKEKNCTEQQAECSTNVTATNKAVCSKKEKGRFGLNTKRLCGIFAALSLAVFAVGGAFGLQTTSSSLSANAYSNTYGNADWTSSEDLLKTTASSSEGVTFNLGVLQSVAKAGGYSTLIEMMTDAQKGTIKTASDFLTNPDDGTAITNGIQIKFGGLYWSPVYLTTDKSGDVVLDLMLSSSTSVSTGGTSTNEKAYFCGWRSYTTNDGTTHSDSYDYDYPSNMYSTSYIRSVLVGTSYSINKTGKYQATSNDDIALTTGTQSNKWYTFLTNLGWAINSGSNSCEYLDTPSQVAYQETETILNCPYLKVVAGYSCPNDAYGEIDASTFRGDYSNFSAPTNTKKTYTDWQYDYVWLPSLTEAGYSDTSNSNKRYGIWKLTDAQLSNDGGTWYRSGGVSNTSYSYSAKENGKYNSNLDVADNYGVRPAIHLNLGKVTGYKFAASPKNYTTTYSAKNISMTSTLNNSTWFDSSYMTVTSPANVKDAGKYTYTVTIADDSNYYFDDGTKTATFTLTVKQAPLTIDVKVDDSGHITPVFNGLRGSDTSPDVVYSFYCVETGITYTDLNTIEPGVYTVSAQLRDEKNGNYYKSGGENGVLEIYEKTEPGKDVVAIPVLKPDTFVYSGQDVNIQDYLAVLYLEREKLTGDVTAKNVGSYSVTVSLNETTYSGLPIYWSDGANNDTREDKTYNYTITKAPLTVKFTVNEETNTVSYTVEGVVNGEQQPAIQLVYTSEETNQQVDPNNLEPGVYIVTPKLADENGNYEITSWNDCKLEIDTEYKDDKLLLAEPVLTKNSFVYSGTSVDIKSYFEALNLEYEEIDGDLNPVNVGNYSVTVSIKSGVDAYWSDFADDDNCGSLHYNFSITKAPLTVVVKRDETNGTVTTEITGMVKSEPEPTLELIYKDSDGNIITDTENLEPGKYTIEAVIQDTNSNYEITDLTPADFDVVERKEGDNTYLLKPELTQTDFTYTGEVIDIINYFKDLDLKFEVVIGDLQPKDVGSYSVTVKLIDDGENVYWYGGNNNDKRPLVYTFTISPAKLEDKWLNDAEGIPEIADNDDKVTYIYYDKDGNPLLNDDGQPATKDDLKPGETYKVVAVVNDENKGNYVFDTTGTARTNMIDFTVLSPAELQVPTLENSYLIYNGEEQTVVLVGYESEYMQYNPVELTKTDPNNYVITISIKDGAYAEWADGKPGTERELEFEIAKAALPSLWEFTGTAPDLSSLPDDATVAYVIRDENGNAVNAEHIKEGERYTVTAILSDTSSLNYYFAATKTDRVSTSFIYCNEASTLSDNTFEDIFPMWSLLIIIVAVIGGAVVWSKAANNIRENAAYDKHQKEQENNNSNNNNNN